MKKSLIRAFLFSLITFFILNFLFFIIAYSIEGVINLAFTDIAEHPLLILFFLSTPTHHFIWELILWISLPIGVGWKVLYIGMILSYSLASIIAGISGGSILKSLGGWVLTSICSIVIIIVMFLIDSYTASWFCSLCTFNEAVIEIVLPGIVNLLIFSGVSILVAFLIGRSK
ncbi:MAG: hypothetical protein ACFE85_13470 [Candidatus Hodarchaeota archaeon]